MVTKKQKINIELVVTESQKKRLGDLYAKIMQNSEDRLNVFEDETDLPKIQTDWHEYYLITSGSTDVGTFKITKFAIARVAEVYCLWVDPAYRKQGLFSLATEFVGNRVFKELGYDKIQAGAIGTNTLANSLYEKELKLEGVKRNNIYAYGKKINVNLYGLLKEESRFQ